MLNESSIKCYKLINMIHDQKWGQIHLCLYLKVFKYFKKIVIVFDVKELTVFIFKYFPRVFVIFKYLFKYIASIKISASRSHVMPAKLLTFTATSSNGANYRRRYLAAGVPHEQNTHYAYKLDVSIYDLLFFYLHSNIVKMKST